MNRTAAFVMIAAVSAAAHADTIEMRFLGVDQGRSVRVTHDSGYTGNVFAGGLRFDVTSAPGFEQLEGEQTTFCVDFFEHVDRNVRPYDLGTGGIEQARFDLISGVMQGSAQMRTETSEADRQAATQLVIWELLYDYDESVGFDSIDFSSGSFQVTRTNGQALWQSLTAASSDVIDTLAFPSEFGIVVASRQGAQDQAFLVPAPATVALGLLGAGVATRRRRG